ncbi:MAG: alpha/beta hydrolase [Lachnospiraceae bacterium]
MEKNCENNQGLLKAVKRMHALVESSDLEKQRASQENFGGRFSKIRGMNYENFRIQEIPAEWLSVERSHMKKYVILYCHGGGFTSGSFRYARSITNKLAASTSMDVLSFDYRLAPEHPHPAALEDALKVWDHLMYQGYGARDVIIAGDSAGGNLALILTLKLKEQKRLLPRGLILFSPWTDLTGSGKSYDEKAELDPILNREYLERCVQCYAPETDRKDPYLSPVFADLTGFPPVYIQVGTNEILLSDTLRLQRQLQKCHVPVRMEYYKGMWHVFQMSPLKTAYDAMDQVAEFIFDICR